jgi:hypothetical protein
MRFEVIVALNILIVVAWVVTMCALVDPKDVGSMFLQNIVTHLQVHTVSQPRRSPSYTTMVELTETSVLI